MHKNSKNAFLRNGIYGSIHMFTTRMQIVILNQSHLLSTEELSAINSCVITLKGLITRWDRNFIKKQPIKKESSNV